MTRHGSAQLRKEESSVSRTQQQSLPNNQSHSTPHKTPTQVNRKVTRSSDHKTNSAVPAITPDLKRRARRLILNSRIPHQTRGMLRYALGIKDPYLPQLVRRVEGGEMVIDYLEKIDTPFGKRPAP